MTTNPEYKFRAVPRSNELPDDPLYFTLEEAMWDSGSEKFRRLTDRKLYHPPDLFTGHTDKDDVDVYGGDVVSWYCTHYGYKPAYGIITFGRPSGRDLGWSIKILPEFVNPRFVTLKYLRTVIGNIHNISALPEKVRGMLESVSKKEIETAVKEAHKLNRELDEAGRLDPEKLDEEIK